MWLYSNARGIEQLTNLQALEITWGLNTSSWQSLQQQLPLQYLAWYPDTLSLDNADAWTHCPTSLTSLSIRGYTPYIAPGVLPHTITHMQLFQADFASLQQVAVAMPWLRSLDVSMQGSGKRTSNVCYQQADEGFQALTQFTALDTLSCVLRYQKGSHKKTRWAICDPVEVQGNVPALQHAAARGVKVRVVNDESKLLDRHSCEWPERSAWLFQRNS